MVHEECECIKCNSICIENDYLCHSCHCSFCEECAEEYFSDSYYGYSHGKSYVFCFDCLIRHLKEYPDQKRVLSEFNGYINKEKPIDLQYNNNSIKKNKGCSSCHAKITKSTRDYCDLCEQYQCKDCVTTWYVYGAKIYTFCFKCATRKLKDDFKEEAILSRFKNEDNSLKSMCRTVIMINKIDYKNQNISQDLKEYLEDFIN